MWNDLTECKQSQPCEYCISIRKTENWFSCPVDHNGVFPSCNACIYKSSYKYNFEEQDGKLVFKKYESVIKHFNGIEYLNILNKRIDEYMNSELKNNIKYNNYFENDYILGCHIMKHIENKIFRKEI